MEEIKALIKFLFGFIPWILFLFLSGHTLASLENSIIISLLTSIIFNFKELRKGFLLQWGTLLFFATCAITINFMGLVSVAKNMGIISNGFLAGIIWITIFIRKPFTLQYARAELPKERWNEPDLMHSCRFIAIIWALLLTFSALIAWFKILNPTACPEWVYFDISILIILGGSIFTTLYTKIKRSKHPQSN